MTFIEDAIRDGSAWYISLGGVILHGLVFLALVAPLPRLERRGWQRALVVAGYFAALWLVKLCSLDFLFDLAAKGALSVGLLVLLKDVSLRDACFVAAFFELATDFARMVAMDVVMDRLLIDWLLQLPDLVVSAIHNLLCAGVTACIVLPLRSHILSGGLGKFSVGQVVCVVSPVIPYVAVRICEFQFKYLDPGLSNAMTAAALVSMAACILVMLGVQNALAGQIRQIEAFNQLLLHRQKEQYLASRSAIGHLSRRCHDLRHELRALRSMETLDEVRAALAEMGEGLEFVSPVQDTGNDVLDIILTEEMHRCREAGITLTPLVNGSALGFMSAIDVSTIFGNALDNAFEATARVGSGREIRARTVEGGGFLVIGVRNPVAEEPQLKGGRPVSTKQGGMHGLGLGNIEEAVRRYGGTMAVETGGGRFTLTLTIPLPRE